MPDLPTLTAHQLEVLRRVPSAPNYLYRTWEPGVLEELMVLLVVVCVGRHDTRDQWLFLHNPLVGVECRRGAIVEPSPTLVQRTPLGDAVVARSVQGETP